MANPSEKLADSMSVLKDLQDQNIEAIKSSQLSRVHRERLTKHGLIREVAKGWYYATNPSQQNGESTEWYASYWPFCTQYLESRFGSAYVLSPEQSVQLHSGNYSIPPQLIVKAPRGSNMTIPLVHDTSLFLMKARLPDANKIEEINGIKCLSLPYALVHCSPSAFKNLPIDVRTALSLIRDSAEIVRILLDGSHSVKAGRLAGAFRNIGKNRIADEIISIMRAADFRILETDPFESKGLPTTKSQSPYSTRIQLMWKKMRETVIKHFPDVPGLPRNSEQYLKSIDDIYSTDAYNSLSIERYKVSQNLIEKVRHGNWDLDTSEDQKHRDAMAARGYYLATQLVKNSISKILANENPGAVLDLDHGSWYRELFSPSITAGILSVGDLAGYRNRPINIADSQHVPMNKDAVIDTMQTLFDLLSNEKHAGVRAVLGHFIFVYIHPYVDGNGRMGRFVMNSMLASGGYPWTVIPVEERDLYMSTLEEASTKNNIEPFAKFISYLVNESLKGTPVAKI